MTKVGFGLHFTPEGVAPWGVFGTSQAALATPEQDLSLQPLARIGGNQNPTNTCVWWAMSQGLWMTMAEAGLAPVWMSVLAGYWLTQMRTHAGKRTCVIDMGCRPPDAAGVISEVGVIKDAEWPFRPERVCEEPKYKALVSAIRDWFQLIRVTVLPSQREATVKHIIHNLRRPVLIGQEINKAHIEWRPGSQPWEMSGFTVGRHMEAMDSYTKDGPLAISSWGDTFRRQFAWSQMRHPSISELWYPQIDLELAKRIFKGAAK